MLFETSAPELSITCIDGTDPAIRELQALRYQVYCLEREFLSPTRFPDRRERDDYDAFAQHFAAHEEGYLVGTVRAVPDSPLGFPIERFIPPGSIERFGLPRDRTCEISRLVLRPDHRRSTTAHGARLLLMLFRAVDLETANAGIDRYIAALEPPFVRLLHRFGFVLTRIGPAVDWFGEVLPCAVTAMPRNLRAIDQPRARGTTPIGARRLALV